MHFTYPPCCVTYNRYLNDIMPSYKYLDLSFSFFKKAK